MRSSYLQKRRNNYIFLFHGNKHVFILFFERNQLGSSEGEKIEFEAQIGVKSNAIFTISNSQYPFILIHCFDFFSPVKSV